MSLMCSHDSVLLQTRGVNLIPFLALCVGHSLEELASELQIPKSVTSRYVDHNSTTKEGTNRDTAAISGVAWTP